MPVICIVTLFYMGLTTDESVSIGWVHFVRCIIPHHFMFPEHAEMVTNTQLGFEVDCSYELTTSCQHANEFRLTLCAVA